MSDTKTFPLDVVLSGYKGRMWCRDFGDTHRLIEHVLGHPVWTHEMGSSTLWSDVRAGLLAQHPGLETVGEPTGGLEGLEGDAFLAAIAPWMAEQAARLGAVLEVRRGNAERTESPLESLARVVGTRPVIVVETVEPDHG